MTKVLADAQYFVAPINDKDQGHPAALAISQTLQGATVVTTEEALTEVPAFFRDSSPNTTAILTQLTVLQLVRCVFL